MNIIQYTFLFFYITTTNPICYIVYLVANIFFKESKIQMIIFTILFFDINIIALNSPNSCATFLSKFLFFIIILLVTFECKNKKNTIINWLDLALKKNKATVANSTKNEPIDTTNQTFFNQKQKQISVEMRSLAPILSKRKTINIKNNVFNHFKQITETKTLKSISDTPCSVSPVSSKSQITNTENDHHINPLKKEINMQKTKKSVTYQNPFKKSKGVSPKNILDSENKSNFIFYRKKPMLIENDLKTKNNKNSFKFKNPKY